MKRVIIIMILILGAFLMFSCSSGSSKPTGPGQEKDWEIFVSDLFDFGYTHTIIVDPHERLGLEWGQFSLKINGEDAQEVYIGSYQMEMYGYDLNEGSTYNFQIISSKGNQEISLKIPYTIVNVTGPEEFNPRIANTIRWEIGGNNNNLSFYGFFVEDLYLKELNVSSRSHTIPANTTRDNQCLIWIMSSHEASTSKVDCSAVVVGSIDWEDSHDFNVNVERTKSLIKNMLSKNKKL